MKFVPKELKETADISAGDPSLRGHLKLIIAALVLGVLGFFALGWIAEAIAERISPETEAEWFGGVSSGFEETAVAELPPKANRLFKRLVKAAPLRGLPFRLVVNNDPAINAFALPGGTVVLTTGLLKKVESDIGLAFVIGHELGHHHHRHVLKRIGRTLTIRAAVALLIGESQGLVDAALQVASASHSRDQEREADRFGLNLVHQVFGTTDGAFEFFQKVQAGESATRYLTEFLASHPVTQSRIAELEALAKTLKGSKK